MKHHNTPDTASGTPRDRFRTPRRPSPQSSSKTSKSTTSKRTASPGLSTSGRTRKRASLPSSYHAQSTLTQIDFVTQTPHPDDDELDYIDNTGGSEDARKAAQPVQIDDDLSEDTEYRPTLQARSGLSTLGMNDDHPKRRRKSVVAQRAPLRKSQTPRQSNVRGKRKSTDKAPAKRDKTLTQMDFVRRYITIDDDDDSDVNMGYLPPACEKDSKEDVQQTNTTEKKEPKLEPRLSSPKRTRRVLEAEVDLSTGEPISQSDETQSLKQPDLQHPSKTETPITPRKPRRLEIPSSQSPESPGLAIITSSQFRSATRSPQKKGRLNFANPEDPIKEESPSASGMAEEPPDKEDTIENQTPTQNRTTSRNSPDPVLPSSKQNTLTTASEVSRKSSQPEEEPLPRRTQRERTVIYETDAETDNDDLQDDIGDGLDTPTRPHSPLLENLDEVHDEPQSPCDDSQDLPLPSAHACADPDSAPPSEAPMSDASMFYRRVQPATQFPYEPIPTLNTQKLSELFPNEGSTQYPRQGATHDSSQRAPPSSLTQTQSQGTDQIEIVPESSPARENENSMDRDEDVFQRPQPPGSVVQVESSQPVDRGHHGPGGMLSRSQLLTSSVMESIPMPNFWIGSQDSVGEPYSLPEQ
ncbi:uncharacterized protein N7496_003135 [Penicillium cataractarum]|uniref:Uncharacterized protein n=1 Tax=Penicillium cataractarum TaxID=2100454 RepID=A0A9W9SLI4_9EURO|nr:uncharacterized protein N7496_003135 [Penicillium cataractarum]KAJ5380707.1 hypothetical protein N7496_003135 [Penicillium cataractarum]